MTLSFPRVHTANKLQPIQRRWEVTLEAYSSDLMMDFWSYRNYIHGSQLKGDNKIIHSCEVSIWDELHCFRGCYSEFGLLESDKWWCDCRGIILYLLYRGRHLGGLQRLDTRQLTFDGGNFPVFVVFEFVVDWVAFDDCWGETTW